MSARPAASPPRADLRVVHVVPNVGAEASGPSYSVPRLAQALASAGHDVQLFSVAGGEQRALAGVTHQTFPRAGLLRGALASPGLRRALAQAAAGSAVLHSHGLWLLPNLYPGWIRRPATAPLVVSPRGTLSPWALGHRRWKKRAVWVLAQRRVLDGAECLHATADEEYRDLRRLDLRRPVCVIPNGVDVPPAETLDAVPTGTGLAPRVLLYLGRLHVKKGIDRLLQAWAALAPIRPDWCLEIAGPDDGAHEPALRALAASLRVPRVTFRGPVYGGDKLACYRRAALHVLPSHSENFGLTVAEALACGTPVIATHGTPWSALERERCGWWIEPGVEPLLEALRTATALEPGELSRRGQRGRAWMQRDFSWDAIARAMADVYRWLRQGGATPSSVRLE